MVSPPWLIRRRSSKIARTTTGARPRLGSSSMRSLGRAIKPRPIAHICCSPPDSVPASWPWRSRRRGKSSNTQSSVSARRRRASTDRAPTSRFSLTDMVGKSCRPSGTWAMPRATTWEEGRPSSRSPANSMAPVRSGRRPEIARRVVVLPAPCPPISATTSPSWRRSSLSRMDILFPEVGLDHPAIGSDLARRAGGDLLPEGQHDDAMRERHHRAHVVLDEQHGDATRVDGAHQADHGVDLRGVEPRHHLVKEEERRLRAERARELEALAVGEGEPPHALHHSPRRLEGMRHGGVTRERGDLHVVEHGELRERAHDLEGARQAEAANLVGPEPDQPVATEADVAVVGEEEAGEQVENRGLPRSVRTDQPQHLALGHGEIEAADGEQSAEALLETRDFEKAHALRRTRRRSAGYAPWGRKSTTAMRSSPYTIRCAPVHPPWAK